MNHSKLVTAFIATIWNKRDYAQLNDFLHPDFQDHSLPPSFPADKDGLRKWIDSTGASFEHTTIIEDLVTENDRSIARIRMMLKHIGNWRGIAATGIDLSTTGYRQFNFRDGRIVAHRALIDGQTIEHLLKGASQGCKAAT
jgi:predicted ester cyclase